MLVAVIVAVVEAIAYLAQSHQLVEVVVVAQTLAEVLVVEAVAAVAHLTEPEVLARPLRVLMEETAVQALVTVAVAAVQVKLELVVRHVPMAVMV
jgi:hypothetical protein